MKNTITIVIVLLFMSNSIKSQTYSQTFENMNLAQLVADSGWAASGVYIGNSNKLSGAKELITQLLNPSTSTSTYLTTYFYKGSGSNKIQFQHVINNSSGKDIFLTVYAIDSANTIISSFVYVYDNASAVNSTWSFIKNGSFKLSFEWSGLKTKSGSTAGLDMIMINKPAIPKGLAPLPVSLLSFKASLTVGNSELNWSTATEENLSSFEVLRSFNGKDFTTLGNIDAKGNSNDINNYNFTDNNVSEYNKAIVYYQLKMIDNDGKFKLSNVSQLRMDAKVTSTVSVFPNPTSEIVNVSLSEMPETDINVEIVDAYGKKVQVVSNPQMNGTTMSFDIRNLENGIYFINVLNADGSTTSNKFIKR